MSPDAPAVEPGPQPRGRDRGIGAPDAPAALAGQPLRTPACGLVTPDTLASELEPRLAGTRFSGRVRVLERVGSTIDLARRLADEGAPEGTAVLALEQEAGRGQQGRRWHSPRGVAIYLTALLRPALEPPQCASLTALVGLAARDAVAEGLGVPGVVLKRPNDLLVARPDGGWRKLAGLLVDTAVQGPVVRHVLVSLGLNVMQEEADFPAELAGSATSIRMETGRAPSLAEAAAAFLHRLEESCRALEALGSTAHLEASALRFEAESRELSEVSFPALAAGTP